jgi:hypothetical protein
VAESTALEKRYAGNRIVGSNPTPSALLLYFIYEEISFGVDRFGFTHGSIFLPH